ncbi:MAG: hypothetical protein JWQ13_4314 [Ramlibacter sp.]|jgi:glycosyltransferase involved in cell wall biosynthesis/regulator of replication initiation timing|nr:hypothetical protein [Ramlibacter sp.]
MNQVAFSEPVPAGTAAGRVVHLVPPNGGGVDRFVRDLCSRRPLDWLLHVSEDQCVVECAAEGLLVPVARAELAGLVERGVLGRAAALHAHSTVAAVRQATSLLAAGMGLRYAVTLHDVEFAAADTGDSGDAGEGAARLAFVREAARCTAPSGFIRDLATRVLGGSVHCEVVENGVDWHARAKGDCLDEPFPVAVIGALGQHKGLAELVQVADALPADVRIVLIGYADGNLVPGWLVPGKIRVHGVFEPEELPKLVCDYGARIAFFPRGQPESYCYALSDAWLAGLAVVGPDSGAIGERVRANGGGSLYEPEAPSHDVALAITRQLALADREDGAVAGAVASLRSVAAMADAMNGIYASIAAPVTAPDLEALKRAAASHLDSRFFRKELLRLQGDLTAAEQQRDNALAELRELAANFDKRGEWVDQLEQGHRSLEQAVEGLRRDCGELREGVQVLRREKEQLNDRVSQLLRQQASVEELRAQHAALQHDYLTLKTVHETMVRRLTWPLRLLPAAWQAFLKKTMKQILLRKGKNG